MLLSNVRAFDCADVNSGNCYQLGPLLKEKSESYDVLTEVIGQPERYKVQVLYTQIDRKPDNQVAFTNYQYGLDESRYFYPASTVKLPVSLLALQWLQEQNLPELDKNTTMLTKSSRPLQTAALDDDSAENKLPSVAHYIKKILLVSDNDGYNRLYELLGQQYINTQLNEKGLNNTVINHRLSLPLPEMEQRHYNAILFVDKSQQSVKTLPARSSQQHYVNPTKPFLGRAHIANNELVKAPMDFTEKNRFSVSDYTGVLKRIFFPKSFSPEQQFAISDQDRKFIIRYMGLVPSSSDYPAYSEAEFPANYAKFLLVGGDAQPIPEHLKIFNKSGWAYGHAIDGAYIVDTKNNIEFIVVAVIYANENDTLNDDTYQLDEIAKPFMRQLGQLLYQHELKRERVIQADLSKFKHFAD
tara:strand:+ start:17832 stop:19070 length:1239 start_codon:yes stop_codon:yes gene_type:complete